MQNPTRVLYALCVPLIISLLASTSAANCTTWTTTSTSTDYYSFGTNVTFFTCDSDKGCPPPPLPKYNLTVDRSLYVGEERNISLTGQVDDEDSIFSLATQGFRAANFLTPDNATDYEFVSRSVILPPYYAEQGVRPGASIEYVWVTREMSATGVVGGCSNASLNGVRVTAASSFLEHFDNTTSIGGYWVDVQVGVNSSGRRLGELYMMWTLAISAASASVAAFLL